MGMNYEHLFLIIGMGLGFIVGFVFGITAA